MTWVFLQLVNRSLAASWLVVVVMLLRVLLRRGPKWVRPLLWGTVAVRLVCPFFLESPWSLIPSTQTLSPDLLTGPNFDVKTGISSVDQLINGYLGGRYFEGVTVPAGQGLQIMTLLVALWIVGMLLLFLYTAFSWRQVHRQVRTAVRMQEGVYQSEAVPSPFVLGIVRPRIYLPLQINGEDIPLILAHERAHICRRDHWWKPLGFLVLTVHWFNPLLWLSYSIFCRDLELACDEKVVRDLSPEQRGNYAQALLTCSIGHRGVAACPLAFGEGEVKNRIQAILGYRRPERWSVGLAATVCLGVAVCFLTNPIQVPIQNPWVQDYQPGQAGMVGEVNREEFETISTDFAIGADQHGQAVFKEPQQAFDTFVALYADSLQQIQQAHGLPPISQTQYMAYKTLGWQTPSETGTERERLIFVTKFLDIYENSFLSGE